MTWDEFVEKYGDGDDDDMLYKHIGGNKTMSFWKDGQIVVTYSHNGYTSRIILSENRTPEQMEQILISLTEEK